MMAVFRRAFNGLVVLFVVGAPLALLVALSSIPGCPRMRRQPKLVAYEETSFFDDHSSMRHPPAGTVARGPDVLDARVRYGRTHLPPVGRSTRPLAGARPARPTPQTTKAPPATRPMVPTSALPDGADYVDTIPMSVSRQTIVEGRNQFRINCVPCHGRAGYGDGIVTHRGFPKPPSYHTRRLRQAPAGYLFDVITNGYGLMYSYGARLTPRQRWATIAYIRALQFSQQAPAGRLAPKDLDQLDEATP